MLHSKCFTYEWIKEKSDELGATDPQLVEKCIIAFELVGRLAAEQFDFVFKGGTSLLLHLSSIKRLSIDADIVTSATIDDLHELLTQITFTSPLTDYEYEQDRDRENPPTKHFKIYYNSPTQGRRWSIQLDVQMGSLPKDFLEHKLVDMALLDVEEPRTLQIPTVDALLGDKLTAFAPTTAGVLYNPCPRARDAPPPEPDPPRVLKQLFDVGELFSVAEDLSAVEAAYDHAFAIQKEARGGTFTREESLYDSIDAAYHVAELALSHPIDNEKTRFFSKAMQPLDNHVLGSRFNARSAGIPAARGAPLAALLYSGKTTDISLPEARKLPEPEQIRNLSLEEQFQRLNSLRKLSAEAFYFWYQASQLLS